MDQSARLFRTAHLQGTATPLLRPVGVFLLRVAAGLERSDLALRPRAMLTASLVDSA